MKLQTKEKLVTNYNGQTLLRLMDVFETSSCATSLLTQLQIFLLPLLTVKNVSIWQMSKPYRWQLCAANFTIKQEREIYLGGQTFTNQKAIQLSACSNESTKAHLSEFLAVNYGRPDEQNGDCILVKLGANDSNALLALTFPSKTQPIHSTLDELEQLLPVFNLAFHHIQRLLTANHANRQVEDNRSQQRLQIFAELASDWFWETDKDQRYFYLSASESGAESSRYQHFIGKTPLELRSNDEKENLKKWGHWLHMTNQRQPIHEFEYEALDANNSPFWIAISGQPQFNPQGEFIGYIGTGRDISFSKQREVDLTKEREKAELASAAKSNFLAVMSHEIRTPMNAILGMLELFEDTTPTERQAELIEFMRSSAQLLQGVITDTLDFAKIESGKLELRPTTVNLYSLLKNLVQQFETQALKQELDFVFELNERVPKLVFCDGLRLSQVLLNLLGNAFKFTPEGQVSLHVSCNDNQLIFRVRDTGLGIPDEKLQWLFDPFTQIESQQQPRQQGVGLGLSITKRLLTLMSGSIDCHSKVGEFSEFIVLIPLKEATALSQNSGANDTRRSDENFELNILVAEDNIANQFVIQAILEKQNHQVTLVENGEEALAAAQDNHFDLVLMDMMMPIMNGVTATQRIREIYSPTQLPIFALTANAGIEDKARCLQAGMNEVLTKPIETQILINKINNLKGKPEGK